MAWPSQAAFVLLRPQCFLCVVLQTLQPCAATKFTRYCACACRSGSGLCSRLRWSSSMNTPQQLKTTAACSGHGQVGANSWDQACSWQSGTTDSRCYKPHLGHGCSCLQLTCGCVLFQQQWAVCISSSCRTGATGLSVAAVLRQ